MQVNGDDVSEPDETFVLGLSNAVNASSSVTNGTGTILDDEGRLTISDPVPVQEGNSGQTNVVFNVTLTEAATGPVSVSFATSNGLGPTGAVAGGDYAATSGTLQFAVGETIKTVTVPVLGDLSDEFDETFTVNLSRRQRRRHSEDPGRWNHPGRRRGARSEHQQCRRTGRQSGIRGTGGLSRHHESDLFSHGHSAVRHDARHGHRAPISSPPAARSRSPQARQPRTSQSISSATAFGNRMNPSPSPSPTKTTPRSAPTPARARFSTTTPVFPSAT